jgi:uncharacterized protein YbjT (DUF2867 family)
VAGATGYTGREVVRVLREVGVDVVAHVRPDSPSLAAWRGRFEALGARVDTTPWEEAAMRASLSAKRPSLVFALLGTTRSRGKRSAREHRRAETYETIDVGLTMLLYQAARGCGSRPRFVYLSAVGVKERTRNAYLAARARVERALMEGDLPYLIARPSFITGPDRDEFRLGERVGARVSDLLLAVMGFFGARGLRERYRSTTAAALAAALVRAALAGGAPAQVLHGEHLR